MSLLRARLIWNIFICNDCIGKFLQPLQFHRLIERSTWCRRFHIPAKAERTGAVIEPLISEQWFVRTGPLAQPAIDAVRERFPTAEIRNDICYATTNRQKAVHAIAAECDLVLVVGSKNSSNSVRLTEIAEASGTAAYLIDDKSELDKDWFEGVDRVLITAGASAPEDLVREIVLYLIEEYDGDVEQRDIYHETIEFGLPLTLKKFMRAHGIDGENRRIVRDDAVALDGWLEAQGITHQTVGMTIGATG